MAYTDLLNEALDDLASTLATITGLPVVTDPRYILPGCVLIQAPSFEAFTFNVVKMTFPVMIIGSGPGNLDALRALMAVASQLIAKKVGILDGRPATALIGGTEQPAYDCTLSMEASTT